MQILSHTSYGALEEKLAFKGESAWMYLLHLPQIQKGGLKIELGHSILIALPFLTPGNIYYQKIISYILMLLGI